MASAIQHPRQWIRPTARGLYCVPGDFYVDPASQVARAIITHGHGDHARPGNESVLATAETIAIMRTRFGEDAGSTQAIAYGEAIRIGEVMVRLAPAGHILGSAQVVLVTEATFGLPVFRHPDDGGEIAKVLRSLCLFPERAHLVGVYGLGKCQRVLRLLRRAGYDRPVYLHGALAALCGLYEELGVPLGQTRPATEAEGGGDIILCPPTAVHDRWSRRFSNPVTAMASGWMAVRPRARQRGVELPLQISDHADWDELGRTLADVGAEEVWVTHGREEALVHYAMTRGHRATALNLIGFDEESA